MTLSTIVAGVGICLIRARATLLSKESEFRAEVERQREQITQEAFARLSGGLDKAVGVLIGLLDDGDKRLRRFAAKDIVNIFLKHRELVDIEQRPTAIDQKMGQA